MKNDLTKKIIKNYLILFIFIFSTELIFRLVNDGGFFSWALLRIFLYCNIVSLLISILISFYKEKTCKWIILSFSFLVSIYSFLQLGFYTYVGTYMSLNTSSQAGKVIDYIADFITSFSKIFYLDLIPYVLLVLYYIFLSERFNEITTSEIKIKKNKIINNLPRIISLGIILVLCFFFYLTLILNFTQNKFQMVSNKNLFHYPEIQNVAVNQFGVTGFFFLDVKSLFVAREAYASGVNYENENDEEKTDNSRIIDDYSWNKVIENETNTTYNNLNNYFINRKITDKNNYTGVFEGKNLIVILMESVDYISLEYPKYYPTINKIYNGGWSFKNTYSPRNSCSTGNNEMSSMTSLYTINNSCTANRYKNNYYPEAIFNLFKNKGYSTSSYHDYIDAYYSRGIIHKNMGSDKYYNARTLGIPYDGLYQEWPSDVDLFNKSLPTFVNNDKFMVYMSTVTTHRPYGVSSEYGDKNLELFSDLDVPLSVKRYMSKLKELDLGLEVLLKGLKESGKLDDTVIILFGDHYPYGLSDSQLSSVINHDTSINNEKDRTPFVIYNSKIKAKSFDKYNTYINILPTVANLFNLDYDPRLYLGQDLFSSDYKNYAVFADGSWQSDKAFYNASSGKVIYNSNEDILSDEKIIEINQEINNMITMSNNAFRYNYFNYLTNAKSKYPKIETEVNNTD